MSYKVYKSLNYFVVYDNTTSVDVIRQVRDLVRWEKKGTLYSFYYNTPNLTTVGNSIIRLGSVYEFSDLQDSTGTAWASQALLDLYLEQWTGHICCNTAGEDALYDVQNTDGTSLKTGAIPSGETTEIEIPDISFTDSNGTVSSVPAGVDIVATAQIKDLFWELNFNGTDDVVYIPATTNNVGTLTSGSGSNVGTITVSTDGVTYGALSFPFTPSATTTYYFKRSTVTVSGIYTMIGTYV
jgi:hypothetical protein